jgi:uncharacterized RmlC-like cupin family protein
MVLKARSTQLTKTLLQLEVMTKFAPIRVVSPPQFDKSTAQTPGSERRAALARDLGVETGLWSGLFTVQPGAKTAIHHHGEQETIAYVAQGRVLHSVARTWRIQRGCASGQLHSRPGLVASHGNQTNR